MHDLEPSVLSFQQYTDNRETNDKTKSIPGAHQFDGLPPILNAVATSVSCYTSYASRKLSQMSVSTLAGMLKLRSLMHAKKLPLNSKGNAKLIPQGLGKL